MASGREWVIKRIIECLENYNVRECAVVIDSVIVTYRSKMLYVRVTEDEESGKDIEFYVKQSGIGKSTERTVVPNAEELIINKLNRASIGGITAPGVTDLMNSSIQICDNVRLLCMESQLYHSIRMMVEQGKTKGHTFIFNGAEVDSNLVSQLINAFQREALTNYGDLIYSNHSTRFISKLQKYNRFYNIQKAFVPVFVEYEMVFNPLGETNKMIKGTKLYQMAMEKNRYVKIDNLSCYFLTHAEICQALGMTYFMRFTPSVLYQVLIGLMYPNYNEFPNKSTKMMVKLDGEVISPLKSRYSIAEFQKLVSSYAEKYEGSEGIKREEIEAIVSELQEYQEVDSLFVLCQENYFRLTNVGSSILDSKENTTVHKLRSYLGGASISMV